MLIRHLRQKIYSFFENSSVICKSRINQMQLYNFHNILLQCLNVKFCCQLTLSFRRPLSWYASNQIDTAEKLIIEPHLIYIGAKIVSSSIGIPRIHTRQSNKCLFFYFLCLWSSQLRCSFKVRNISIDDHLYHDVAVGNASR